MILNNLPYFSLHSCPLGMAEICRRHVVEFLFLDYLYPTLKSRITFSIFAISVVQTKVSEGTTIL